MGLLEFKAGALSRAATAEAAIGLIEKSVRNAIAAAWGKRPVVHVLVIEV